MGDRWNDRRGPDEFNTEEDEGVEMGGRKGREGEGRVGSDGAAARRGRHLQLGS